MAEYIYLSLKEKIGQGEINWTTDTIKGMLVTDSYTVDTANHIYKSDVSGEASGTGYTAGGKAITNPTVTKDYSNNWSEYDADDLQWPNSTIDARGLILYKDTGDANTSPLIAYFDFGQTESSVDGIFTVHWSVDGAFLVK